MLAAFILLIVSSLLIASSLPTDIASDNDKAGSGPVIANEPGFSDVDSNGVDDALEGAPPFAAASADGARTEVIVWLNRPVTQADLDAFRDSGGDVKYVYAAVLDGFAGSIPLADISAYAGKASGSFHLIEKSRPLSAMLNVVTRNAGARPYVWNESGELGYRGSSNASLAIIDTGIDGAHADLGTYINVASAGWGAVTDDTKIVGWYDVQDGTASPVDPMGHGSHCSGIATGRGAGSASPATTVTESYSSYVSTDRTCRARWYDVTGAPGLVTLRMNASVWVTPGGNMSLHVTSANGTLLASNYSNSMSSWNMTTTYYYAAANGTYGVYACNEADAIAYDFALSYTYPVAAETDGFNRLAGVAPENKLVGVRVLDSGGYGTSADLIAGFNWVAVNKAAYRIRVASASLGMGSVDPTIDAAANNLTANGIVFTVASGNSFPTVGVGSPGSASKVLTVAALDDFDNLTYYSSPGSGGQGKPDVACDGGSVYALGSYSNNTGTVLSVDTGYDDNDGWAAFPDIAANDYIGMQGTSMATPAVAGIAALVAQALEGSGEPWNYSEAQALKVKMLILMTASETNRNREAMGGGGGSPALNRGDKDTQEGFGRVNVEAAVEAAALAPLSGTQTGSFGSAPSERKAWARKVQLTAGRNYTFTLTVPGGADYDLYLYNGTPTSVGDPVIAVKSINATAGTNESVTFNPSANGTYYLVAKRVSGSGAWSVSSPGSGWLYGAVTDADGAPLSGVLVNATNAAGAPSNYTNATGEYILAGIPPGAYTLRASLNASYRNATQTATVSSDEGSEANFSLLRIGIAACGIELSEPADYFVEGPLSASGSCITLAPEASNSTVDCRGRTIAGNLTGDGVFLNGTTNVTVRNCTITNFNNGISIEGGSGNTVTICNTSSNYEAGISASGSLGTAVAGNTANSNFFVGIFILLGSNQNRVWANNASGNGESGLHVDEITSIIASGNHLTGNNYSNLYVHDAPLSSFSSNNLSGGRRYGLYAYDLNSSNFSSNQVDGNANVGMWFITCSRLNITGNTANGNALYGIQGETLTDSNISGNTANFNTAYDGIYLLTSSIGDTLTNNSMRFNGRYGLNVSDVSRASMASNNLCNNNHSTYDAKCGLSQTDGGSNTCRAQDSCAIACAACPLGWVEGHLTGTDGAPVIGALVNLTNASGSPTNYSDANGDFIIAGLATGTYSLNASNPPGYSANSSTVSVLIGEGTAVNLTLTAHPGWLYGTILDFFGAPLSGVLVNATNATLSPSNVTNATGGYVLYGVYGGTYAVSFRKNSSFRTLLATVSVQNGLGTESDGISEAACAAVSGLVQDSDGNPVASASITARVSPTPTPAPPSPTPTPTPWPSPTPDGEGHTPPACAPGWTVSACPCVIGVSHAYTLAQNLTSAAACIRFDAGASNSTLDCRGHSITTTNASGTDGIYINAAQGVNVTNCTVSGFYSGFVLADANSNSINASNASRNVNGAYVFAGSSNNRLTGNIFDANANGVVEYGGGTGNNISGNEICQNAVNLSCDDAQTGSANTCNPHDCPGVSCSSTCSSGPQSYRADAVTIGYIDSEDQPSNYVSHDVIIQYATATTYYAFYSFITAGYGGVGGGYAYGGFQEGDTDADRSIHFTVWDPPSPWGRTSTLYVNPGATCFHDDSEGSAMVCHMPYQWAEGSRYRMYVDVSSIANITSYEVYVYDFANADLVHLSTFSYPRPNAWITTLVSFIEDFGYHPFCTAPYRAYLIGDSYKTLVSGGNVSLCTGEFGVVGTEYGLCGEHDLKAWGSFFKLESGAGAVSIASPSDILERTCGQIPALPIATSNASGAYSLACLDVFNASQPQSYAITVSADSPEYNDSAVQTLAAGASVSLNFTVPSAPTPSPTPTPVYRPPSGGSPGGGGGDSGPPPTPRPTPIGGGTPLPPGCSGLGGACASSGDCCDGACSGYVCVRASLPTPTPSSEVVANITVPGSVRVNETVRMTVRNAKTGQPIANATVQVTSPTGEVFTVVTDASGCANFSATEEGLYTYLTQGLRASAPKSTNAQAGVPMQITPTPRPSAAPTPTPGGGESPWSSSLVACGVFGLFAALAIGAFVLKALFWKKPTDMAVKVAAKPAGETPVEDKREGKEGSRKRA